MARPQSTDSIIVVHRRRPRGMKRKASDAKGVHRATVRQAFAVGNVSYTRQEEKRMCGKKLHEQSGSFPWDGGACGAGGGRVRQNASDEGYVSPQMKAKVTSELATSDIPGPKYSLFLGVGLGGWSGSCLLATCDIWERTACTTFHVHAMNPPIFSTNPRSSIGTPRLCTYTALAPPAAPHVALGALQAPRVLAVHASPGQARPLQQVRFLDCGPSSCIVEEKLRGVKKPRCTGTGAVRYLSVGRSCVVVTPRFSS